MKASKKGISALLFFALLLGVLSSEKIVGIKTSAVSNGVCEEKYIDINVKVTDYNQGDIIEFGNYPQSEITDETTLKKLNSLTLNWKSYGYYSGDWKGSYSTSGYDYPGIMTSSNYMRYADVSYNGIRYRAVYFDSYRPDVTYADLSVSVLHSRQIDNGYKTEHIYWFIFEPIKWRVLDPQIGLVMSEKVIDSQPYSNYVIKSGQYFGDWGGNAYWGNDNKTHYASDYAESDLRDWLNNDFYNTAFNDTQKSNINNTSLNNSSYLTIKGSTSSLAPELDSESTNDKIFVLSYSEALNSSYGFKTSFSEKDSAKSLYISDYGKCQGGFCADSTNTARWWLRTPGATSLEACGVAYQGTVYSGSLTVCETQNGVVPAMRLAVIKTDISGIESNNPPSDDIPETNIIKNNPANNQKTYDYKTTVTFTANVPSGGSVQWYIDGKKAGTDSTLTVKDSKNSYTVTVVVTDKNGNQTMDEEKVTIKNSFFDKLIWFFVHLFNPGAYDIKQ